MEECGGYMETCVPFPICNHTAEIGKENLAYTQGMMLDGVPFEAELWENEKETCICFYLPEEPFQSNMQVEDASSNIDPTRDTVRGIEYSESGIDCSALGIGMVDRGYINDVDEMEVYLEYLERMGVLRFTSPLRNGVLHLLTDVEGHDLVCLTVSLLYDNELQAETPLEFREFPGREGRKRLKVVK